MYPSIAKNLIYPLGDFALGTSVMKYYHELQKTQWWPIEQLQEMQNEKLRKLIKHAYTNVPYYEKMFNDLGLLPEDISTSEDLKYLPILTKTVIKQNYCDMLARNFNKYKAIANATGGSTGEPLKYYITKDAASINWAGMYRAWGWAGYKIGERRAVLGGSSLVPNKRPTVLQAIRQRLERNLSLSIVAADEKKYGHYVDIIRKYKPKLIYGYPSSIYLFAEYCQNNNINDVKCDIVACTAEVLLPQYRQVIQQQFRCVVYDQYGAYDGGGQALECKMHNGFHISSEKCVMEIVDEKDNLLPAGKAGRMIVTDLHNYAMPFIRYEVGDIGVMDDKPCSCGRGLPLLKSIEGRTADIIKFSNGVALAAPAITLIFKDCNIKQYQVVQQADDALLVRIVKGDGYSEKDRQKFMNLLQYHAGPKIKIEVEYCEQMPVSANSKHRFIISKQ